MSGHAGQADDRGAAGPAVGPLARLDALDVDATIADPARKQQFVTPMFDVIAPRYDAFTRLFSFGMDRGWKRQLLERVEARLGPAATILDIACGTGDLAVQLARSDETRRVLGIDASTEMVRVARRQHGARPVVFVTGDVMALPLPTGSISAATAGYAIRNAPTLDGALSELARVIAPGGWIGVLDFYRPSAWWWRALFLGYLRVAGDLVGWWWHRRPVVYGYIARSIARFTSVDGFGAALERAGFEVVETRRYLLGGIAVHVARRVTRDSSRAPT